MLIQLNGEQVNLSTNLSIQNLLDNYNIDKRKIAIERNGEIVFRKDYEQTFLKDDDRIEIIHFIGGG